jgi:hypothetical protein
MVSTSVDTLLIHLMIAQLQSLASIVMLPISLSPNHLWNITGKLLTAMVSCPLKVWEGFVRKNTPCALNAAFFTLGSLYWSSLGFYFLLLLFCFPLFFTTIRKAGEVINSSHLFWNNYVQTLTMCTSQCCEIKFHAAVFWKTFQWHMTEVQNRCRWL